MEGRYQFSSPEWDDRSDTVKDLVRLMNSFSFARSDEARSNKSLVQTKQVNLFIALLLQISRLLVVDPVVRLTAEQALAHPFFRLYQKENVRRFIPRKTFRVG